MFQPEPLSDASFISYENKFRCSTCVQIILSDWRSSQKRKLIDLHPVYTGSPDKFLNRRIFYQCDQFLYEPCKFCCRLQYCLLFKTCLFPPAFRGNVRRIWASFCPDLCKRALREFPHSKYFFCYALRSKKEVTRRKSNVHPCTNFEPNGPWCVDYKQTSSLSLSNHKGVAFSLVYFLKGLANHELRYAALLASLYDR